MIYNKLYLWIACNQKLCQQSTLLIIVGELGERNIDTKDHAQGSVLLIVSATNRRTGRKREMTHYNWLESKTEKSSYESRIGLENLQVLQVRKFKEDHK